MDSARLITPSNWPLATSGAAMTEVSFMSAHSRGPSLAGGGKGNLLAHERPGTWRGLPAASVQLCSPYQLVAVHQVDEAVVGELRYQRLGDLTEGRAELKGAG